MVRRPLLFITISFAGAVLVAYCYNAVLSFIICAALLIINILFSDEKEMGRKILLLTAIGFFAGTLSFAFQETDETFLMQKAGSQVQLKAEVSQIEMKESNNSWGEENTYLQVKAVVFEADGKELSETEKMMLKYYGEGSAVPGDIITVNGIIHLPDERRNPGCFDYNLYLRSIGIRTVMTAEQLHVYRGNTFQGKLYVFREKFLDDMENVSGEETAGLMRAIMFGSKTELDENILEEFQKNGTAHVLAVSGLHVGILYSFIVRLWRWKKGFCYFMLLSMFFACYIVMASFSPSVIRASVMVAVHVMADLTGRRYDLSSAAFLTALAMMAVQPMQIFNAGFQMSFLAVLTLSLLIPVVKKLYKGILVGSIAVQAGLLPYTLYTYNYLSLAAVFINIPVIFLTGIIVPVGLCSAFFSIFCRPLFELAGGVLEGLCIILTRFNSLTCIEGMTVFSTVSPYIWMIAVYYLSILFYVSEEGRLMIMRRYKKTIAVMTILMLTLSVMFSCSFGNEFRKADLVFVDSGQGDCMHLRTDSGSFLIDGGGSIRYNVGKKTLKPYLLKNGEKKISGAFVTHLHTDHYKGVTELCMEGMVEKLFVYDGNRVREKEILRETGLEEEDIVYLSMGQTVRLDDETSVTVLWPEKKTVAEYEALVSDDADENESSLILRVDIGEYSMIATGDVDGGCLDQITEIWGDGLDADILKVPHHGSKYSWSERFTEAVSPDYAIFQVGKNNFGHPDQGVVENYLGNDIMVYRNDEDGAVGFDFAKDSTVEVMTVRGEDSGWLQEIIRNRSMHL